MSNTKKTEPVNTTGATKETGNIKTKDYKDERVIYVGPTILGVASNNTVFNNGITLELKKAIKEMPVIGNLILPIEKLSAAQNDINSKKGAMYAFYNKAMQYAPKEGE